MRAEILRAFYTILLGNPTLKKPPDAPMRTRFKMWWRLVGSGVEHAAKLAADRVEPGAYEADESKDALSKRPCQIDFQNLFLARDDEDEDSTGLAEALAIMRYHWPVSFCAADVAKIMNEESDEHGIALRDFLYSEEAVRIVSPRSVGKRLQSHLDEPAKLDDYTLTLCRTEDDTHTKTGRYTVKRTEPKAEQRE